VLGDVVENHLAALTVSWKILFERGVFAARYDTETYAFATTAPKRGLGSSVLSGDGPSDKQLVNDIADRAGTGQLSLDLEVQT
jgi:hypothetical protein